MSTNKIGAVLATVRNGELAAFADIEDALEELEAIRKAARVAADVKLHSPTRSSASSWAQWTETVALLAAIAKEAP